MIVGFAADVRADRVIGIDASAKPEQTREQITRIARHTAELVGLGRRIEDAGHRAGYAFCGSGVRFAERRYAGGDPAMRAA
ncbi:UNVERIFIED_ORG: 1-aminocyclopropane-1-carboxylate deaminase/D-cysteine desulfhydrase-like pyridoxal-dependent ACC family enzyme [Burkholderia territorii]